MTELFMRAISLAPVIDPKDKEQLHKRVEKIINHLKGRGEDPLLRMRMCQTYLADRIFIMKKERPPKSWIMRNKNPRKIGTYAWLKYMFDQITAIVGVLADRKLQESIKLDTSNSAS